MSVQLLVDVVRIVSDRWGLLFDGENSRERGGWRKREVKRRMVEKGAMRFKSREQSMKKRDEERSMKRGRGTNVSSKIRCYTEPIEWKCIKKNTLE